MIEENVNKLDDDINETFTIDSDKKAEWALNKIKEKKEETERYVNICNEVINEYEAKKQSIMEKLENNTSYLKSLLLEYFKNTKTRKTKTQEILKLPAADLVLKKQNPKFVRDDNKLLEWLENGYNELIKIKKTPNWEKLKKTITVKDGKVINDMGEIVNGVTAIEQEDKFIIKFS